MAPGSVPPVVFLERQSYRRRRLMDAARLLPLFGVLLFSVPLLWPVADPAGADGDTVPMSDAMIYVFLCWTVLIGAMVLFGLSARLWTRSNGPQGPGQG
ncbi:hypothetical protein ACFMPD_07855 [Sedimentitalea sp. HM32M-2]|uniref:hypothetical protein n=1 Tax=Sedimentitalea sp. HM32M-2 TaxID=3351566 RepID=UPI0036267C6A